MKLATIPMEQLAQLLQTQLTHGGTANLIVTGNSMYPMLLSHRDSVRLVVPKEPLRKGDLILYRREEGAYILHRIVSKPVHDTFFCCGDNQWIRETVTRRQVIAVVDRFTRKKKQHDVRSFSHRLYVALWVALLPVRRPLFVLRRKLGRLRASLRK
ncbi:MAG: S24/S26 family peptidase [Oscillospiraceae bacterium]|nr:S24/S26 family peptidase [Oscillospiraceae bacterium]